MNEKLIHRITGAFVFLFALVVYFMTVQPSVSFWDCGEFIASSYLMQVPHPPGTPFFLILGRLFSMIPFADNIAFRVNTVSVLSSAFTILFLYLTAVKIIVFYKKDGHRNLLDSISTRIAAAIGALSLAFGDTFWFNAVEAEVYALATFFIAFVVWVMLIWNEKADEPDNEKYLIFIAYLIGLSIGVHLMSVLAIVPIVMTIMYRKYFTDDNELIGSGYVFLGHVLVIMAIAVIMWVSQTGGPTERDDYFAFDSKFKAIVIAISIFYMLIFRKKIFNRNSIYLPMIFGAIALFGTYPGIVKYVPNILAEISGNNTTVAVVEIFALFGLLGFAVYFTGKNNQRTLNLIFKCFLFALIGFTSYASIIIRSNQDTPINLNSPKSVEELVKYLNREQYGDFPILKRRYSSEPHQRVVFTNYSSDLDFLYRYQMNHMFQRYLLWNYSGRDSTIQDSDWNISEFFAIPFLLGLFGLYFHFRRDWKLATVLIMMFIFLGYLTAFYQNQQEPQPRERDYFYVGAFFVFSIWIALGVRGIIDLIYEYVKESKLANRIIGSTLILGVIFVPANMLGQNYFDHNRSRNFVPWDYSYNILQSAAPNAILFTNGDNDTFPLWYLQDVEGVRRDVRIANLSLLNTEWYIKQLKNTTPFGADKIKMDLSDFQIDRMCEQGYIGWKPSTVSLEVPENVIKEFNVTDTSVINKNKISWKLPGYSGMNVLRIQDAIVKSIVEANKWERPIYFAVTCSDDSRIGLDDYMRMEGLAFRLMPQKGPKTSEYMNAKVMTECLFDEPEGFSKNYQPGFKFRGLNDPTIFMDDNHERMCQNYRNSFLRLALYYYHDKPDSEKMVQILDKMEEKIPRHNIPMDVRLKYDISNLYFDVHAMDQYNQFAQEIIDELEPVINRGRIDVSSRYSPFRMLWTTYDNLQLYEKSLGLLYKLQEQNPEDPSVKSYIAVYKGKVAKQKMTEAKKDSTN